MKPLNLLTMASALAATAALISGCRGPAAPTRADCVTRDDLIPAFNAGVERANSQMANDTNRGRAAGEALTEEDGRLAGYNQAYTPAYRTAYDSAYRLNYDIAYPNAVTEGRSSVTACNQGLAAAQTQGTADGYDDSYPVRFAQELGALDGSADGYAQGGIDGYNAGYLIGYDLGEEDGAVECLSGAATDAEITSCDSQGFAETYRTDRYNAAFEAALAVNAAYNSGFTNGVAQGSTAGQLAGNSEGGSLGSSNGRRDGIAQGEHERFVQCFDAEYPTAYAAGQEAAYDASYQEYYVLNYNLNHEIGKSGIDEFGNYTGTGFGALEDFDRNYIDLNVPGSEDIPVYGGGGGVYVGWSDGFRDGYRLFCPPFGGAAGASRSGFRREVLQSGRQYGRNSNDQSLLSWATVRTDGQVVQSIVDVPVRARLTAETQTQLQAIRTAARLIHTRSTPAPAGLDRGI